MSRIALAGRFSVMEGQSIKLNLGSSTSEEKRIAVGFELNFLSRFQVIGGKGKLLNLLRENVVIIAIQGYGLPARQN
jgi:hypothetical protein